MIEFSHAELNNALAVRLKKELEAHLDKLRAQNDSVASSEIDTAVRRGEIKVIKSMIRALTQTGHKERSARPNPYS